MNKCSGRVDQGAKSSRRKSTSYSMSKGDVLNNNEEDGGSCYWMPDARTGIYCPKGHESVMDNVPQGAASLEQTYWLRNVDGVDKPEPDYQFHV